MEFPVYEAECEDCGTTRPLIFCAPAKTQAEYDAIMGKHALSHQSQDPETMKLRVIGAAQAQAG